MTTTRVDQPDHGLRSGVRRVTVIGLPRTERVSGRGPSRAAKDGDVRGGLVLCFTCGQSRPNGSPPACGCYEDDD